MIIYYNKFSQILLWGWQWVLLFDWLLLTQGHRFVLHLVLHKQVAGTICSWCIGWMMGSAGFSISLSSDSGSISDSSSETSETLGSLAFSSSEDEDEMFCSATPYLAWQPWVVAI